MTRRLAALALTMFVAGLTVTAQPTNPFLGNAKAIEEGREFFNQTCTTCHGPNGAAGEMGPALGAPARRYAQATDAQIFDAIKNGIPGTQMPPARAVLPDDDIWKVAAYIRGLRGTAIDAPAAGDAALGEQIFWGKGTCGNCHVVKGKGGLVGPDLTNLAGTRKTTSIVDALTKPLHKVFGDGGAIPKILIPNTTYQPVRVTAADGTVITGVLKNEDSYSLQVMGTDNRLHMFDRAKVKVVYETRTLMPTDYDKRLAPDEFRNLLAYLTRLHVPAPSPTPARGGGEAAPRPAGDYFVFVGSYRANQVVLDSSGKVAVTVTYNSGTVTAYGVEADGRLSEGFYTDQHTGEPLSPRVPAGYTGNNSTAEIQIDAEGRFLYVTNRGHDTIAVYSVDPAKGTLTMIENVPSLGRTPRNITIDPANEYLISANQGGENVVVFRIDRHTGHLTPTGSQQPVAQAGGLAFVKAQ